MNEAELKSKIRKLIGEDNLDSAIELLTVNTKHKKVDEIIIQQARYNRIKKDSINGTVPLEEINRELNTLRKNLLSFIRSEDLMISTQKQTVKFSMDNFKESFAISFTKVKTAEIFLEHYDLDQALTIAEIMHLSKLKSRKILFDFLNELSDFKLIDKCKADDKTVWKLNVEGKHMIEKITKISK